MIRSALVFGFWAAVAASLGAQAPISGPGGSAVVVVRGQGEVRASPDVAFVTFGIEQRARTSKEAQSGAAKAMATVSGRLTTSGVGRSAMRTLAYSVQPEYSYSGGKATLKGYVARNAIEVRVDDLARLGELLDTGGDAGATSVVGPRFEVRNRAELEREALKRATSDARARAEAAAAGVGAAIVSVVRIEETGAAQPPIVNRMMETVTVSADVETPIIPGEVVVTASVTLTAAIK